MAPTGCTTSTESLGFTGAAFLESPKEKKQGDGLSSSSSSSLSSVALIPGSRDVTFVDGDALDGSVWAGLCVGVVVGLCVDAVMGFLERVCGMRIRFVSFVMVCCGGGRKANRPLLP